MRALLPTLLAVAAACSHAKRAPPPAPIPLAPPLVAFEAVKVEGLGFLGANLTFRGRVENPNATPISVVRVEYALDLEGGRAAQGGADVSLAVAAADPAGGPGLASVPLPVELRYAAVPGVAKVLALEHEAAYVLGGAVTFLTPNGPMRIPFGASGRLAVPRAPRFHVDRVVLRSASPREIALEMQMGVRNPNDFPIPPGRIGCGLHLQGREVVRADVEIGAPIAGGEAAALVVPIRISPLKAGKAVARLLVPFTSVDVAVKGEAVFGGVPVPLDLTTNILPAR